MNRHQRRTEAGAVKKLAQDRFAKEIAGELADLRIKNAFYKHIIAALVRRRGGMQRIGDEEMDHVGELKYRKTEHGVEIIAEDKEAEPKD